MAPCFSKSFPSQAVQVAASLFWCEKSTVILILFCRYPVLPLQKYHWWEMVGLFISDSLKWKRAKRTIADPIETLHATCTLCTCTQLTSRLYLPLHTYTYTYPNVNLRLLPNSLLLLLKQLQWTISFLNGENALFPSSCQLRQRSYFKHLRSPEGKYLPQMCAELQPMPQLLLSERKSKKSHHFYLRTLQCTQIPERKEQTNKQILRSPQESVLLCSVSFLHSISNIKRV